MKRNPVLFFVFLFLFFNEICVVNTAVAEGNLTCKWILDEKRGGSLQVVIEDVDGEKLEVPCTFEECASMLDYECKRWKGSGGATAIHFRAFGDKKGRAFEVFIAKSQGSMRVVWSGLTGFSGELGEREGYFLDYEPVSGSSLYPILYRLDERVQICGFGPAPLEVKMFDFQTSSFRSITFDRMRRIKRQDWRWWGSDVKGEKKEAFKIESITGSFEKIEGEGGGITEKGFLVFESSSSMIGGGGEVIIGAPANSLDDGKTETGWIEGSGGDGTGEFVTMKTISRDLPVEAFLLNLSGVSNNSGKSAYGAIKRLLITTDSQKVFKVDVPLDPRKIPDKVFVINFPEKIKTKCFSLIIDEVYPPGAQAGNQTYLAEVSVKTEIADKKSFLEIFSSLMNEGKKVSLLNIINAMPTTSSRLISEGWDEIDEKGKEWLVLNISGKLFSSDSGFNLAGKEFGWIMDKKRWDLMDKLLSNLKSSNMDWQRWKNSPPREDMAWIAYLILSSRGDEESLGALINRFLTGLDSQVFIPDGVNIRPYLLEGLKSPSMKKNFTNQGCLSFDEKYRQKGIVSNIGVLINFLHLLVESGWFECAGRVASNIWKDPAWKGKDEFEVRYHILNLLEKVLSKGCNECDYLFEPGGAIFEAISSGDEVLTGIAIEIIENSKTYGKTFESFWEKLLTDSSPIVRAKTIEAMRMIGLKSKIIEEKVLEVGSKDFWPEVRLEAVKMAFNFDRIDEEKILGFLGDESFDVKKEGVRLVVQKGISTQRIGKSLIEIASNNKIRGDVREESAMAFGRLCLRGFEKKLVKVVEEGLYPDSGESQIYTASAAIKSLGMLGWKGAVEVLELALSSGIRGEIKISAIEALGKIGGNDAVRLLELVRKDSDKYVREVAEIALENAKKGGNPECGVVKGQK